MTCECGCGQKPSGRSRFLRGHNRRLVQSTGYRETVHRGRRALEHRVVAEQAIGRSLPAGAEVHHVDGNRRNNVRSNLVVCQSKGYHQLLHTRAEAKAACGHANYRRCRYCKQHDDPKNLSFPKGKNLPYHLSCNAENSRLNRVVKKGRGFV